jgi:Flp pilus assembly protein TadD
LTTPVSSDPGPAPSPAKSILAAAALLVIAVLVAWSNSLEGPFVLDDIQNIAQNESIQHLGDWRQILFPPADRMTAGRPVLNLSFAINYALGKDSVRGYHIGNLAIHVLAALALFGLVRRTLRTDTLRPRFGATATWLALGAALLWALHPLQTAAVTYISQRAESLMSFLYLMVLYCLVRGAASGAARAWQGGAVVAYVLAIATKEGAVTAPLVALLFDRTFLAGSFRSAWQRRRWFYVALIATSTLLVLLMRGIMARGVGAVGMSPLGYLLIECRVVPAYLKLALWPHPLVFDYGDFDPHPGWSLAGGAGLLILLSGIGWALVRHRAVGFLGAWFFLLLAPTSSVVPVTFQPMGENRVYLPLAALGVSAVMFAGMISRRFGRFAVLAAALAGLVLTLERNAEYRDPMHFWAETLALRPHNARALNEYSLSLAQAGRVDEATASFRRAIALRPDSSVLHRNLGLLLARQHRMGDALPHLARVAELEPKSGQAHQEYGHALAAVGKLPEAIDQMRAGVKLVPTDPGPHLELARLFAQNRQVAESLAEFAAAVGLAPVDPDIRNEFAAALLLAGRESEAMAQYEAGLQRAPEHPGLLYNYGRLLISAGRPADALPRFETLVRLQPESASAHFALANTLAALGHLPEAMPHYEATLQLDPNLPQAREFYDLAKARLVP